jgi:hypothetical protein
MDGPVRPDVPPEDPQRPRVFSPEPVSSDRPPILAWATAALVVAIVLLVKPWGPAGDPSGQDGPSPGDEIAEAASGAASPSSTPLPSLRDDTAGHEVAGFCLDPGIWLVATVEGYGDRARRLWRAMETTTAAVGPSDRTIPTTLIVSEGVRSLGWCAPVVGRDRPSSDATVEVWRIDGDDARPLDLDPILPPDRPSPFGVMYAAPTAGADASPPSRASWPDGRLVFRYASGQIVRWFAIQIDRRVLPGVTS